MDWFSSDYHLGHANIIKHCKRPFESVEEMDEVIITRLLTKVSKGDTLYFGGDLSFSQKTAKNFLQLLKDRGIFFVWILGNHDHHCNPKNLVGLYQRADSNVLYKDKSTGTMIHLSHYPLRVWSSSFRNSFHLYGHVHNSSPELDWLERPPYGKSMNINVEFNDYYPYSLDDIIKIMEFKPDNEDYLLLKKQKEEEEALKKQYHLW